MTLSFLQKKRSNYAVTEIMNYTSIHYVQYVLLSAQLWSPNKMLKHRVISYITLIPSYY